MKIEYTAYRFAARILLHALCVSLLVLAVNRVLVARPRLAVLLLRTVPREVVPLAESTGKVLYLGDSVIQTVGPDESGERRRNLAALLEREVGMPVADASHAATGAKIFRAQLRYLIRHELAPRALVVPLNLRNFSPHAVRNDLWESGVRCLEFDTELFLPLHLGQVFGHRFARVDTAAFLGSPVVVGGVVRGTIGVLDAPTDFGRRGRTIRTTRYLTRYATDIRESDVWPDAQEVLRTLRAMRLPAVAYVTPLDLEEMRALLAPADYARVEASLAALRELLASSGVPWLDLSGRVPHAQFDHDPPDYPSEHLFYEGRALVAREVARRLSAQRP